MSDATIATLRAIEGVCMDALMDATRVVFTLDPNNPEHLAKFLDLQLASMKKLREIHMLVRDQLATEDAS